MCNCENSKETNKLPYSVLDFEEYTYFKALENREIILNSEVDDYLLERVAYQIIKWNREDKDIPVNERKEIEIILNSPGGDVYLGMALCSVIEKSETPITITVIGNAASMGALLLVSGAKHGRRRAYEFSNVLFHDGSTVLFGSSNKVKDHVKFQEEKDQQVKDFIIRNTKITEEKYEDMKDREWWLTASSALEWGVIDEII
ncbi:ClpP family protease [Paenibacillus naphthalenovorans]|uniref:ATP-dependent Clp protease proteolytic subunit n=1 Tax=Paenibacillus naphthalenovorans TaxID=162209 RepID=A0A0U2U7Y2_9BACL|nr:ATP-dependent Clp protease proteolytic subunit [Paenibacillus naphthalenovorans]ALS22296.1 Clp protease [Paenibacillus naphthalenovorans]